MDVLQKHCPSNLQLLEKANYTLYIIDIYKKRATQSEIMVNVYKWNIAVPLIKVPSWRWVYHDRASQENKTNN